MIGVACAAHRCLRGNKLVVVPNVIEALSAEMIWRMDERMAEAPTRLAETVAQESSKANVGLRGVGEVAVAEHDDRFGEWGDDVFQPGGFGGAAGVALVGERDELIERKQAEVVGREVDDEDMDSRAVETVDNPVQSSLVCLRRPHHEVIELEHAVVTLVVQFNAQPSLTAG